MKTLKQPLVYEVLSNDKHPEHETRNTSVSEYFRKYGQGRIDALPTDSRPEVTDNRSVDDMLNDTDKLTSSLGTEHLDALLEMQTKAQDFETAFKEVKLTAKQRNDFDKAIAVLRDNNASILAS